MTMQLALAIALHQLATVVWVGGMFFAHFALRASAQQELYPPERLALLLAVFDRFFVWVWIAVVVVWASGFWIFGGIYGASMGWHVHAMMLTATVMSALFVYIYFVPYRAMGKLVAARDWPEAAARLGAIRRIILVNLLLGLLTAGLGSAGRYLQ
ncbi:MAG: CopD family protein [Thiohalocapsa sp.]